MMRLVRHGLMFGNLVAVTSGAMVGRYNRALKHLTGKQTELTEFHVDISGFSPEIGDELGDALYLNPNGCNRQFILLTTEQKTAPLLNAKFSTSRTILRQFIDTNEQQLFALTARDAVAGELVNSVYTVTHAADLFDIKDVEIEADTTEEHVAKGRKLRGKIDTFLNNEDAWWDDVLIADMIELAKKTGDVTRNPIVFETASFEQSNFYTSHFDGLYIFRDVEHPAAISTAIARPKNLPIKFTFTLKERNEIATFFKLNNLVEPIVKARDLNAAALLQQRMDFMLIEAATVQGATDIARDRRSLRALARQHYGDLPDAYHGLAKLLKWTEDGGRWPRISSEHPSYFYTIRATQSKDRDLVNMLLAELTPLDPRQLFICHKERFYDAYRGWAEAKKSFVADYLAAEYASDKAATRSALFGPETPVVIDEDPVVGPWGVRT